jgi:hypothetical protein
LDVTANIFIRLRKRNDLPGVALFRRPGTGLKSLRTCRARVNRRRNSVRYATEGDADVLVRLGHAPISLQDFGKICRSPQFKQHPRTGAPLNRSMPPSFLLLSHSPRPTATRVDQSRFELRGQIENGDTKKGGLYANGLRDCSKPLRPKLQSAPVF